MAGLAAGLTGCGESLTNVQSAEIVTKQPSAVAGPVPVASSALNATSPSVMPVGATPKSDTGANPLANPLNPVEPRAAAPEIKTTADAFVAVTTPGNTAYKIGPEDVLDVSVFKVPELSRSVQVADGGTVNLPLVGEIQAAGKTARDVELDLTKKLGDKYLQSPQVTVYVKEYNSQRVTVEGAVKKPGVYPIRGKSSLLQMIANAGGFEEIADQGAVIVVRQSAGKRYAGKFDLDAIRKGTVEDPAVQQGDVIIANTSDAKAAFQGFIKLLPVANVLTLL